jgi:hypothetical protein
MAVDESVTAVQMHIARRRASIDFFLKTEMDKTVIDLYNKFKANAPLIAFVPDPSDLIRSDYTIPEPSSTSAS